MAKNKRRKTKKYNQSAEERAKSSAEEARKEANKTDSQAWKSSTEKTARDVYGEAKSSFGRFRKFVHSFWKRQEARDVASKIRGKTSSVFTFIKEGLSNFKDLTKAGLKETPKLALRIAYAGTKAGLKFTGIGIKKGYGYYRDTRKAWKNFKRTEAPDYVSSISESLNVGKKSVRMHNVYTYSEFKKAVKSFDALPKDAELSMLRKSYVLRKAYRSAMFDTHGVVGAYFKVTSNKIYESFAPVVSYYSVRIPKAGELTSEMYNKLSTEAKNYLSKKGITKAEEFVKRAGELGAEERMLLEELSFVKKFNYVPFVNAGFLAYDTYSRYKSNQYDLPQAAGAAFVSTTASFGVFEVVQPLASLTLGGANLLGIPAVLAAAAISIAAESAVMPYYEQKFKLSSKLESKYRGLKKRGFNQGIVDTRMAATMRQASLQAIQRSHMTAREFILGNEATMLQRTL